MSVVALVVETLHVENIYALNLVESWNWADSTPQAIVVAAPRHDIICGGIVHHIVGLCEE